MCCVDLLVILSGKVRAIVEIEESGFLPTKICGKFLQSALASNFIHDSRAEAAVPFGDEVLFVQVLDGSKCLKKGTRKDKQAALIEGRIREILPLMKSSISDYRLLFVLGEIDKVGLTSVAEAVLAAFNLTIPSD